MISARYILGSSVVLVALFSIIVPQRAVADVSQSPVLVGSLYKIASTSSQATPVVGASVYLHPSGQSNDVWIGPNLTDGKGRFVFYNTAPGSYVMRIYSGTIRLWQQLVTVPRNIPPIVIRDVRVVYYPKDADQGVVDKVLNKLELPYDKGVGSNNLPTNIIWFGDQVSIEDVRTVADALLKAGVQLRAIRRFHVGNDWRAKVIEVGASPQHASGPTLTILAVDSASNFPRAGP
jgi:hypothetical protein